MRVVTATITEPKINMILPAVIRTVSNRIRRIYRMVDTGRIPGIRMRHIHEIRGEKGANQGDEGKDSHE